MKPNLSLNALAATLAVLGASTVIAACGGSSKGAESPVGAKEVPAAGTSSTTGHASCSAAGCGAKKDDKSAASCGAKKDDKSAASCGAKKDDKSAASCGAKKAEEKKAEAPAVAPAAGDAPAASAAAAPKAAPTTASPAKAPAKKPTTGGQSACGAGTCSAKK
jgi:hypothetical protein